VRLFMQNHTRAVQSFILKLVNNNCPELVALNEGPRLEKRVNICLAVLVVPVEAGRPLADEAFTAVTREFCATGLALVLDKPTTLSELIIGFPWEDEMTFLRATVKHSSPMGGGFYQIGLQATEVVHPGDFPELRSLHV
jgi:hypothetical protein